MDLPPVEQLCKDQDIEDIKDLMRKMISEDKYGVWGDEEEFNKRQAELRAQGVHHGR